jgi:hypothetical protein
MIPTTRTTTQPTAVNSTAANGLSVSPRPACPELIEGRSEITKRTHCPFSPKLPTPIRRPHARPVSPRLRVPPSPCPFRLPRPSQREITKRTHRGGSRQHSVLGSQLLLANSPTVQQSRDSCRPAPNKPTIRPLPRCLSGVPKSLPLLFLVSLASWRFDGSCALCPAPNEPTAGALESRTEIPYPVCVQALTSRRSFADHAPAPPIRQPALSRPRRRPL